VFVVWLAGVAALALFSGIAWYLAPLTPNILALQFAFTPRAFGEVIHAWPAEHLLRYRAHLPFDFALLVSYGAFGYLLASRTALFDLRPQAVRSWATWALPLAAALDATENAFHYWLTAVPRFGVPLPYALSATCSTIKWLLLLFYALTVAYALSRTEG
jgi:hypothetical protein